MFPRYALFGMGSFFLLWMLSVVGGIAVLLIWVNTEPELDKGVLTRGGHYLVRARALLTIGCVVFWICTILGHALTNSSDVTFGFWQKHPLVLDILFFLADSVLIASVVFAWQSRGEGEWMLRIATLMIAAASIIGSFILCFP
ncbi:MAG: hypothetical protein P4L50_10465 [Anaerolineaceae bacterium]|nr:hypothetical protein [Anaerolineaceae bacterium]